MVCRPLIHNQHSFHIICRYHELLVPQINAMLNINMFPTLNFELRANFEREYCLSSLENAGFVCMMMTSIPGGASIHVRY